MKIRLSSFSLFFLSIALILATLDLQAAKIVKVKGKKILIKKSSDEEFSKGESIFVMSNGKKKAKLVVSKVKGNKVFAVFKSGSKKAARKGATVGGAYMAGSGGSSSGGKFKRIKSSSFFGNIHWGLLGGLNINSMDVVVSGGSETVATSGNGFSAKVMGQYFMSESFSVNIISGLEGYSTSGESTTNGCDSTSSCTTDLQYITGEAWGQFYLNNGGFSFWIGAGGGIYYPASSTTTALNADELSAITVFSGGAGVDWLMGNTLIPIRFEYSILPSTDTVEASFIGIKAGIIF